MFSTKSIIHLTCFAVLSEIIYRAYKRLSTGPSSDSLTYALMKCYDGKISTHFHKVLFFPDSGLSCRRTLSGRQCKDKSCLGVHEGTSLNVLLNVMRLTKKKLDVCVYMITCGVLGDAIVECLLRGVFVRVITEERNSGEEGEMSGAQIGKLRKEGVPVRCSSTSFWMHHKFLVADDEVIVNGSFNWTNQAIMGNFENLIVSSEKALVDPFVVEFQKLWDALTPRDFDED